MDPTKTQAEKRASPNRVLRTSLVIFLFLVAAKLVNFFKKILIGQLFGVSWVADSFFAASYLPYYLAIFFEGILFLGFLPIFSQVMAEKNRLEADRFVREMLVAVVLLTGVIVGWAFWSAPWVIRELVPGFTPEEQKLTCSLFRILSLVIVFISLASFFKALNSYFEHYAYAASSGLVDTAVMIGITLVSWRTWGIFGAAWGAVVGSLAAFMQQAVYFFTRHPLSSAKLSVRNHGLGKLAWFLFPMGMIWGLQQIPFLILNRFGSGMWEGTISSLNISQTLTTVPMGLVSHTVLFAIFPSLAKQANDLGGENLKETFFQTLRGGFLILVPAGFLLTGLARPIATLFFTNGDPGLAGTFRIANSLACFGWATFALYADLFMTQSLIAVRKTVPAIFLCGTRALLTYFFCYFFTSWWDYQGLAFGFSLALAVNFFIFFPLFFRFSSFKGSWANLYRHTAKLFVASIPVLLAGWIVDRWSVVSWAHFPKTWVLIGIGGGFVVGMGIYAFLLSFLRVKEIHSVFQPLKEGWIQKNWWFASQNE